MDRLNLTLDIRAADIGQRRVNVRGSLLVSSLIATVKDKHNLDGEWALRLHGMRTFFPLDAGLIQLGIVDGTSLVCMRLVESTGTADAITAGVRQPFSKNYARVYLREQRTLVEFNLRWQPALIGRRDLRNPSNNRLLSADLEDLEELPSVSRHHAAITEKDGSFYIEPTQERNAVLMDGARIRYGERHPLQPGAVIKVGNISLSLQIIG